jgi:RNA polymerase sigma factor (sigma-70 family)
LTITVEIIDLIRKGDRRTTLGLYQHTFNVLMGNAVRYKRNQEEQMEIVNNAFMKIITNIDRFEPGTAYFSWAKRIVQREIIDDFRRNKRYRELFNQDVELTRHEIDQCCEIDDNIEAEELKKMLDILAPATRLVFNLYAIDGYSAKEITEELEISYETVKWHIKEARKKLRSALLKI